VAETWTVTVEETNAPRTFERRIVRKIYGLFEEGEQTLVNENKHRDEGHITGGRYCKIHKIPPIKSAKTNGDSSDGRNWKNKEMER
jgi:hypothetical protein